MSESMRTAVAASSEDAVRAVLPQMLALAEIELVYFAKDASETMIALTNLRPDLLVCDAQLVGCDGAMLVEDVLRNSGLPVRPRAILLHYPEFLSSAMGRIAEIGGTCVCKPLRQEALLTTIDRLRFAQTVFLPKETAAAERILDYLGFPRQRGRECLKIASLLCAHDERYLRRKNRFLYPEVARRMGIASAQAEREIRAAIEAASGSGSFENQYRIFADTVDAERGQPTCGEMIARLADILRLEG